MRLHCSWVVLVAIVWTFQPRNSATEFIKNESTERKFENSSNEYEKSVSTYNNHDKNRSDNGSPERSKDESNPPLDTTDIQIITDNVAVDDIIVNIVKNISLPEYTNGNKNFLEPADSNHYGNDKGVFQPLSQKSRNLISLKENTTVSQDTNEGANCSETSQASKPQKTSDVKTDDHVTQKNRSPHDKTEHEELPTVVRKSEAVIQHSVENFQDIMSSTTEYSSKREELLDFSTSATDNFTSIARIAIDNDLESSSSDSDSIVSSNDTKSRAIFFAGMKIDPGNHVKDKRHEISKSDARKIAKTVQDAIIDRAQERSTVDRTIINMVKPNLPEKILDTNKLDERQAADTKNDDTIFPFMKQLYHRGLDYPKTTGSFVKTTNLQRKNTNRAAINTLAKNNREIELPLLPRGPADFHISHVSSRIASGLSEQRAGKSLKLPAAHNFHVAASFSENNLADGLRQSLTRISSQSSPYPTVFSERSENHHRNEVKDSHKKPLNVRGINYLEPGKNKREFYLAPVMITGSGKINDKKTTITSGNKAEENEVFASEKFGGRMDKVERVKLTDMLGEARGFRRKVQLDNTSNRDSEKGYSIFRSAVKNTLMDSQMKNRDHKILISPTTTRGIDFQQQQQQQQQLRPKMQDQKKSERKLLAEIDSLEKDGFHLKNGATVLENSSGFSLAVETQHDNNVLDSISSVTPRRTRKIGLSASEPGDTRASWKMKPARKHLIILRATEILEPLGSQKWQRSDEKEVENNVRGKNYIKKDLVHSIGKIDDPVTSDSLQLIDSSFAKLYQNKFGLDNDRGNKQYDCNDRNKVTKEFRAKCWQQRSKAFSYRMVNTSNSRKKSGHIFGGWRTTVGVDSIGVTPDNQRKRKRWKDKIVDATIATDTMAPAFKLSASMSLRARNNQITDVGHANFSDKKYVKEDRNDEAREEFPRQLNDIRKVKIDETSGVSTVNRLKLRDSTVVNDDAPETQRETRNDIAGETFTVEPCEACKIVAIVENTRSGSDPYTASGDDPVVGAGDSGDREQSQKKIKQSIRISKNSKDTIRARITKRNEMPILPIFSNNDVGSSERPSAKFILIDRLKPKVRVYRRMHQKNSEMLVPGRESIFIKPEAENLIFSPEEVAHQPLSSGKLTIPDGAVTSRSMVLIQNEKIKNSSSLDQHVGPPKSSFPIKNEAHEELKHGPLISGLTESFTRTRISNHEFPNNTTDIPRDYENFNTYSTLQTRSLSGSGRRRKSVGHEQRTESWTSSNKIDSTTSFSIDRSRYNDESPMNEKFLPHSHSEVSIPRYQDGKLPNNGSVEQIKREFTSVESTSIPVTAPALTSSYGHSSSITAAMLQDRVIKSTETIIQTTNDVLMGFELSRTYPAITEINKASKSVENPSQEIDNIPVVKLSSKNPIILDTSNPNPTSISSSSFVRDKSLMVTAGQSANSQQMQNKQTPGNAVIGTGNIQTFNYTVTDNLTRTTAMLNQWPVKYSAVVEGDLVLGGLMMVHEREDSVTCGPVMPQGGVQALEAMLYTLDWVNKRDLVPGVKIGAHILDDCDKDTYGLEMAVDFIKASRAYCIVGAGQILN